MSLFTELRIGTAEVSSTDLISGFICKFAGHVYVLRLEIINFSLSNYYYRAGF